MGQEARTLSSNNATELAHWCGGVVVPQYNALDDEKVAVAVNVPTEDGVQRAQPGDTIIEIYHNTFRIERAK